MTEQSQPEWRTMGDDEEVGIRAIGLLLFAAIVMMIWAIVSQGGLGGR